MKVTKSGTTSIMANMKEQMNDNSMGYVSSGNC